MRRSRRTLNKLIVELSQAPARPNVCAQCNYVFDYPDGAPWNELFQLVCEHRKTCLACPSLTALSDDTRILAAKRTRTAALSSSGPSRRRKKNVMDKGARRQLIESDSWVRNATSKSVECKGCGRTIKLDKRSDYYPGLWHKHRNKCSAIRRLDDARKQTKKITEAMAVEGNARSSTMTEIIPSSTELLVRRGTTHARISRWTTSSGLRYHTVSSYTTGSRSSRSASPDDRNESYTVVAHTGSLRHMRAQNLRKEDSELARLNDVECSDDEDYWGAAPFGPGTNTPNSVIYEAVINLQEIDKVSVASSESTSERRLYRYSTRRELVTRYEGAMFQGGKVSEPCSEEVMQAAHCLVSMKSRTSV